MRDLAFLLFVGALLPIALLHPWVGIMLWTWISVMNPHRLLWTINTWPVAATVAGVTLLGLLLTRDKRRIPLTPATITLALFALWICVASAFAIKYDHEMFSKVMKIIFMIFIALIVLSERRHIEWLTVILTASIAFYGVKGGVFTLATGGGFRVWGPPGTFIGGNNEIALAIVLIIPLMYFFYGYYKNRWLKFALIGSMVLCAIAALGTHSRGALLAIVAMAFLLWWRSDKKLILGPVLFLVGLVSLAFLPEEWWLRMQTMQNYEQDQSAMGRINAWHAMFNIAKDRFFGGGFDIYRYEVFQIYAPVPEDVHAAHSIYLQVLGEHGFIGLFLYLMIGFFTWQTAAWIRKHTRGVPEVEWTGRLAAMCQVSMFGFAVGGAFLSLAYFDLPYNITVLVVIMRMYVERKLKAIKTGESIPEDRTGLLTPRAVTASAAPA
ncbi:MAG TPA: putative O-glycosylation ligase, exosortase A system-associated [Burkholderiales bacterium]|nr:putative O-glycosylation ligase, exosortase A system-associated [Burkholderiales bacterium]